MTTRGPYPSTRRERLRYGRLASLPHVGSRLCWRLFDRLRVGPPIWGEIRRETEKERDE